MKHETLAISITAVIKVGVLSVFLLCIFKRVSVRERFTLNKDSELHTVHLKSSKHLTEFHIVHQFVSDSSCFLWEQGEILKQKVFM